MKHETPCGMSAVHIKGKVDHNAYRSGLRGFFVVFKLLFYKYVQTELPRLVYCIFFQTPFLKFAWLSLVSCTIIFQFFPHFFMNASQTRQVYCINNSMYQSEVLSEHFFIEYILQGQGESTASIFLPIFFYHTQQQSELH
mgnify:CR=1 FL=1